MVDKSHVDKELARRMCAAYVSHQTPFRYPQDFFFRATCSAISSAGTSSLVWIFFSRYSIRCCSGC
jgi:hypothetical protein